jgi:protein-disulfide isomerase
MKLIKFSLPNCQPCEVLAEQMKKEGIEPTEISLFEDIEELGMKFGIRNVPTVVVLDEQGVEVDRARNIEQLKEILK